ncbi:hypothetical protein ACHAAC_16750 [Aeromicrobium sp. CF4.19]|uniref:hypothetical protein n=1 Tax=Aeromicrobium sp. CF4.19 TaxID=3373082 RepID=UPI003EE5A0B6
MIEVETAAHVAVLDPMTGYGSLVMPSGADVPAVSEPEPVVLAGGLQGVAPALSLHDADLSAMLTRLDGMGWEPLEDEQHGGFQHDEPTASGKAVVGLFGREPITTRPSLHDLAVSNEGVRRALALL